MQVNTRLPSFPSSIPEGKIFINEYFSSIQGEGFHTGKAAFFIRFSGCDIGCKWCDSRDAISLKNGKMTNISEVVEAARLSGLKMVVITGGEPALHKLGELTEGLKNQNMVVHLETSGAYPLDSTFDWLTLSPKKISLPLAENYGFADEMKVVISETEDFEFALNQEKLVKESCRLFLQPEWKLREKMLPLILEFLSKHSEWRLSLQVHKYLNVK